MNLASLQAVVQPFGLRIKRMKPYASLYKSNAVFRALTNDGVVAIKPFRKRAGTGLNAVQQMEKAAQCMLFLTEFGYAHMPRWRQSASGRFWMMEGGKIYYIADWIEGREMAMTERDLGRLGQALARLHSLRSDSSGERHAYTLKQISLLQARAESFRRKLDKLRHNPAAAGRWFAENGTEAMQLSQRANRLIAAADVQEVIADECRQVSLIHGDVTIPNVIVDADDNIRLIDWDSVREGSVYAELAKTLANTTGFNARLMESLLRGYREVKPLAPAECRLVAALFRYPLEAWQAADQLARGKRSGIFPIVERTWGDRLNAVAWLDEWAGAGSSASVG